jgi:hypothetical protein
VNLIYYNYRFADEVLNSNLGVKNEIIDVLKSIDDTAFGISRPDLNKLIEVELSKKGWETQVAAFGAMGRSETKLDFLKSRIGVEVQFGHASFIGIDLLKMQVASYAGLDVIDIGIYVAATKDFAKEMIRRGRKWEGSLTFEKITNYLPHFKSAIHVPILVIGLQV